MQDSAPNSPPRKIHVGNAARVTLTALAFVAIALMLWRLAPVVLLAFGAALIAILLRGAAEWAMKWTGLSYGWALGLVVTLLLAASVCGLIVGGQRIAGQMADLAEQVPRSLEKLREDISQYPWGRRLAKEIPTSAAEIPVSTKDAASYATGFVYSVTGALGVGILLLFLALFFAVDPGRYVSGAVRLVPPDRRQRVGEVLGEMHQTLRWWLLGKIVAMFIVGICTAGGLALLGVPLATALGVIAALLTFIPNFGPILSAIPAVLLALAQSPMTGLYVALLYLAIQTVESYLISPLIQQRTVSLPPALTITAQVAMGILFGAAGVVLATPLAAATMVAVTMLYVEDGLERPA